MGDGPVAATLPRDKGFALFCPSSNDRLLYSQEPSSSLAEASPTSSASACVGRVFASTALSTTTRSTSKPAAATILSFHERKKKKNFEKKCDHPLFFISLNGAVAFG
jgi:hypothetical protein